MCILRARGEPKHEGEGGTWRGKSDNHTLTDHLIQALAGISHEPYNQPRFPKAALFGAWHEGNSVRKPNWHLGRVSLTRQKHAPSGPPGAWVKLQVSARAQGGLLCPEPWRAPFCQGQAPRSWGELCPSTDYTSWFSQSLHHKVKALRNCCWVYRSQQASPHGWGSQLPRFQEANGLHRNASFMDLKE